MSAAEYAADVALVGFVVACFALGAVAARVRVVPGWTGAPARLVEAVLFVAGLVLGCELLGVVHLLEAPALVVLAAVVGVAGAVELRGAARAEAGAPPAPPSDRAATAVALGAVAVVVGNWAARTAAALAHGMPNVDTLWYHMPLAGRFAQDGSFAALAQTEPDPLTAFYPASAELVHAAGIVLTGHDALSPFLNLAWLALALLAAWCIGRPYGAAPATLLGACLVLGSPLMTTTQAGDASNDVAALALFLAAAALLVHRAPLLAAVPAGLALGMKVSMIAPVAALLVAVVVFAAPDARRRLALTWGAALAVLGGLWYGRNLLATGNPLPAVDAGILPAASSDPVLQAPETGFASTLAHRLTESGAWDLVKGGFDADLGPLWWAILAAAILGLVAALAKGEDPMVRALGATGLVVAVAWVFTPQSGTSFTVNVRHLTPALVLGLALVPIAASGAVGRVAEGRRSSVGRAAAAGLAILFVVEQLGDVREPGQREVWVAAALGAALILGAALLTKPRRVFALVAALALVPLFFVQRAYLDDRYADPKVDLIHGLEDGRPLSEAYAWARHVEDATIALFGTQLQYPLMGQDVSNRVRYVHDSRHGGRVVHAISTCEAWRDELEALDADYVVVTPVRFPLAEPVEGEPRESQWTRSLPGADEVAAHGGRVFVYATDDIAAEGGCTE